MRNGRLERSKLVRISPKFEDMMRKSSAKRVDNNIDKKTRSLPEMTDMLPNTPSFDQCLKELETIPKKEDLRLRKWN